MELFRGIPNDVASAGWHEPAELGEKLSAADRAISCHLTVYPGLESKPVRDRSCARTSMLDPYGTMPEGHVIATDAGGSVERNGVPPPSDPATSVFGRWYHMLRCKGARAVVVTVCTS